MTHVEIERTYLLSGMPDIPAGSEAWRIEQGYFSSSSTPSANDELNEGRIRRAVKPDGSVVYAHTVKTGSGAVRSEVEREISQREFEAAWPETVGMRLTKTRFFVPTGDRVWEIDQFDDLDLVLAEVELPDADAPFELPAWLKPHLVREVTDEPAYTNASIAFKIAGQK